MARPKLPAKIFALDRSIHEVLLRGSFNVPHSAEQRTNLLAEIARVLEAGGTLRLHMLTGQRAIDLGRGTLPGPAGYVTHVPSREQLLADLASAGFESIELENFDAGPCFTHEGVAMWETLMAAHKAG
jgi:hypothetical protein